MALKTIRIGSAENIHQYDDGSYDSAIETDQPIKAGSPIDSNDVLRKADIGTVVGDVVGPAAATDNAAARFNGAGGKNVQDSLVDIDDSGNITIINNQQYRQKDVGGTARPIIFLDSSDVLHIRNNSGGDGGPISFDTLTGSGSAGGFDTSGNFEVGGSKFKVDPSGAIIKLNNITVPLASAYTPTNVTTDRSYDANATTVDELADVLGTLIADLQSLKILS